ncbi:MAG: hypothetical protein ACYDB7_08075, partial [Mycobacteriales bacterium]
AGNAITDNSPGSSPYAGTTYLALQTPHGVSVAVISRAANGATTVAERAVPGNHTQVLFPSVAVDRAGTIYLAWTDASTYQVNFVSSRNQGRTWSPITIVNGAPAQVTVMPWIVAGDPGRVDVVFYGSAQTSAPTNNSGPWYPYLAQSLDASSAHPTFTQGAIMSRPNHIEPVCLSGLGCTTNTGPSGDRNLGDFFKVTIDREGRALISFADGDNQLGTEVAGGPVAAPSFADFIAQASGPSLYASVGDVPVLPRPRNAVSEPPHHDPVPLVTPGTGAPGPDAPALELLSSATSVTANGNVHVHLSVANLSASLPAGVSTAVYLTRWVYADHVYYAAAQVSPTGTQFFDGNAMPVTDGLDTKYAYYPAQGSATGTVDTAGNTIDIVVPGAEVGSPTARSRLSGVTSYGLAQSGPTQPAATNTTQFPQIADVLPAYDVVPTGGVAPGGGPAMSGRPAAASAAASAAAPGGALAVTGLDEWALGALGLALLAAAGAVARRARYVP